MLLQSSARAIPLAAESVQCVVTSPPYWGLRQYAGEQREVWGGEPEHVHEWGTERHKMVAVADKREESHASERDALMDGMPASTGAFCCCGAWYGALGLEPTPDLYVEHIVEVFREVRRVLRKDGTLWLNLGDSYAGGRSGPNGVNGEMANREVAKHRGMLGITKTADGLKPKDLVGIPWMVAFALRADGWYLRSDIIWHKPNPMPESVTDRPTKSHEYVFLLTKSERYYYDADAIREPIGASMQSAIDRGVRAAPVDGYQHDAHNRFGKASGNRAFSDAESLARIEGGRNKRDVWTIATHPYSEAHFATYPESLVEPCILAGSASGDRILDPFNGSGTTGAVALRLGREYVGTDLSREYLAMAERRIGAVTPVAQTVEHAARVAGQKGAQLTMGDI